MFTCDRPKQQRHKLTLGEAEDLGEDGGNDGLAILGAQRRELRQLRRRVHVLVHLGVCLLCVTLKRCVYTHPSEVTFRCASYLSSSVVGEKMLFGLSLCPLNVVLFAYISIVDT